MNNEEKNYEYHHGHEHHQGHSCTNDHENEHHYDKNGNDGILLTHHNGAIILSLSRELPLNFDKSEKILQNKMEELSAWVNKQGGLVGHIKAYVTQKSKSAMISTTGNGCNIIPAESDSTLLDLTVIVFMVDEHQMCHRINEMLEHMEHYFK